MIPSKARIAVCSVFFVLLYAASANAWFLEDFQTRKAQLERPERRTVTVSTADTRSELLNDLWVQTCKNGSPAHSVLQFLKNGTINYTYSKITKRSDFNPEFKNGQWEIADNILEVSYNSKYAVDKYKILTDSGRTVFDNYYSKTRSCKIELEKFNP